jgi:aminomethyltransferase
LAFEVLRTHANVDLEPLGYYRGVEGTVVGRPALISRTGYTGEDGFEVIISASDGPDVWYRLMTDGKEEHLRACGLGARDTLRLEAAMPLYGHELDETIDPLTAGLSFAVKLGAGDFIGKSALLDLKSAGPKTTRVGLVLSGKRIAREGASVLIADREVGKVTSGTFSPTLQQSIAMAYVQSDHAQIGNSVEIDIRGKREAATIVKLPFYKRA